MEDFGSRIGKIRKGETVIVNVVSEPLQEKYNDILRKSDEFRELEKKYHALYPEFDDVPASCVRELMILKNELSSAGHQFWIDINDQYGTWKIEGVGIRNGYCLVKMRGSKETFQALKKGLEGLMEELGIEPPPSCNHNHDEE